VQSWLARGLTGQKERQSTPQSAIKKAYQQGCHSVAFLFPLDYVVYCTMGADQIFVFERKFSTPDMVIITLSTMIKTMTIQSLQQR